MTAADLLTIQMRRADLHIMLHVLETRMGRMTDQTGLEYRSFKRVYGNLVLAMLKADMDIKEEEARQ